MLDYDDDRMLPDTGTVDVILTIYFTRKYEDGFEDRDSDIITVSSCKATATVERDNDYGADADGNRGMSVCFIEDVELTDEGLAEVESALQEWKDENPDCFNVEYVVGLDADEFYLD